jgi:hypothetical protein
LNDPRKRNTGRASRIASEVLLYLVEHPDAQDTLQGITDWWLMERRIKEQSALVQAALAELVANGLVVEEKRAGVQTRYRINRDRYAAIMEITKK